MASISNSERGIQSNMRECANKIKQIKDFVYIREMILLLLKNNLYEVCTASFQKF